MKYLVSRMLSLMFFLLLSFKLREAEANIIRSQTCPDLCEPITGNTCQGSIVRDSCNCMVCAKQIGEQCGGKDDSKGFCENALRCQYNDNDPMGDYPGVCVGGQRPQVSPPTLLGRFFQYFGL